MDLEEYVEEGLQVLLPMMTKKSMSPKDEQVEAISSVLRGHDTTCCLPTGFGKSMVFFALPAIHSLIKGKGLKIGRDVDSPLVVVTSPLISLMKTHVKEATEMGIKGLYLPDPDGDTDQAEILFASPEHWTSPAGNELLRKVKDRVLALAVDEAHVAPKWGRKERAFRAAYSKMRDLRSYLPGVPVLAMTATASKKSRMMFQRHLGMFNVTSIVRSPDRGNIYLTVAKVKDSNCMLPLIEELREKQLDTPRTIIYCKSVNDCTELYKLFDKTLGQYGYIGNEREARNCLFAMFFHETLEQKKEMILEDLMQDNGHFRVIIATNSLGMGVNLRNCNRIVHYGVPRDLEDYLQEIGRAGRSGEEAEAQMYYRAMHLLGCNDEIKDYVKNTALCRRSLLMQSFAPTESNNHEGTARCCDICSKTAVPVMTLQERPPVRSVSDDDIELLQDSLEILKSQIGQKQYAFGIPVFPTGLIQSVKEQIVYIDSIDYIALNLPVIDPRLALEIYRIICEVFDEPFRCEAVREIETTMKESYLLAILANVDFSEQFSEEEFADAADEQQDIDSD